MTNEPDKSPRADDTGDGKDETAAKRTWREWFVMVCDRIGQTGVVFVVLGIIATLFAVLARWFWLAELVASLRIHLAAGLVAAALLAAIGRRWVFVAVAVAVALANSWHTVALYVEEPATLPVDADRVRLVVVNVLGSNDDPDPLLRWLDEVDADIVLLVEVNEAFVRAFESRSDRWPHQAHDPQHGPFGLGVASRIGFSGVRLGLGPPGPVPVLDAEFNTRNETINLIGLHTLPPATPRFTRTRDELLQWAAARAASETNVILVGDLNATTTSPAFRRLLSDGGFVDTRSGFGRHPTWPAALGAAGIGIDHVLLRGDMITVRRELGPDIGSDHLPVLVEIAVGGELMPASDR